MLNYKRQTTAKYEVKRDIVVALKVLFIIFANVGVECNLLSRHPSRTLTGSIISPDNYLFDLLTLRHHL